MLLASIVPGLHREPSSRTARPWPKRASRSISWRVSRCFQLLRWSYWYMRSAWPLTRTTCV